MHYYVYILSNSNNGTIYVGITNDLPRRVYEHKKGLDKGSFSHRYNTHKLVYYEDTENVLSAIEREKQIKSWSRAKKNALVNAFNPAWADLYEKICR